MPTISHKEKIMRRLKTSLKETGVDKDALEGICEHIDPQIGQALKGARHVEKMRASALRQSISLLVTGVKATIREINKDTQDLYFHMMHKRGWRLNRNVPGWSIPDRYTFAPLPEISGVIDAQQSLTLMYPEFLYPQIPDVCQCGASLVDDLDFEAGVCRNCFSKYLASQKRPGQPRKKYSDGQKTRRLINEMIFNFFGGSCAICGYNEPGYEMYTCHHVDPSTKKFNVSNAKGNLSSWDSLIVPELNKCVLLCLFCHATVHKHLRSPQGLPEYISRCLIPGKRPGVDASMARAMGF